MESGSEPEMESDSEPAAGNGSVPAASRFMAAGDPAAPFQRRNRHSSKERDKGRKSPPRRYNS